jgi:hypothetical protein
MSELKWHPLVGKPQTEVKEHLTGLTAKGRKDLWTDVEWSVMFDHCLTPEQDELLDYLTDQLGPGGEHGD